MDTYGTTSHFSLRLQKFVHGAYCTVILLRMRSKILSRNFAVGKQLRPFPSYDCKSNESLVFGVVHGTVHVFYSMCTICDIRLSCYCDAFVTMRQVEARFDPSYRWLSDVKYVGGPALSFLLINFEYLGASGVLNVKVKSL